MNSNRDGLVVIAVRSDNHLGLGSISPAEPDALSPVTFQDERQPQPGEGCQRAGEIVQSAARSSASR